MHSLKVGVWLLGLYVWTVSSRDVVVIHSTDIHGWVNAHPHNSTLNADFGDYFNFVTHMKEQADQQKKDLLIVDTGDLVEGTGISDATNVHGEDMLPIVRSIPYSALTTGNHDVGRVSTTTYFKDKFIPSWDDAYVSANVVWKPTGSLWANSAFKKITTKLGTKVLIFGFMFDFDQAANTTVIQRVEDVVQSDDFIKVARASDADLILIVSHISPNMDEYTAIYKALRAAQPKTPLALMAGHQHKRVFKWFDDNAFSIESGKYFEHLGLITFSLGDAEASAPLKLNNFSYKWIDTNVDQFMDITKTDKHSFPTQGGNQIKEKLQDIVKELDLEKVYGCSQRTYDPYSLLDDENSLYGLVVHEMIPKLVLNTSLTNEQFYMCNTESLRYDVFKGPVTKNDVYTTNPFKDKYLYFKGVDGEVVSKVVAYMNKHPDDETSSILRGCVSLREESERESTLPRFVTSSTPLKPGTLYDVIMPEYDSVLFSRTMVKMGHQATPVDYPTAYDSTSAMGAFFAKFYPCQG